MDSIIACDNGARIVLHVERGLCTFRRKHSLLPVDVVDRVSRLVTGATKATNLLNPTPILWFGMVWIRELL